MSVRDYIARFEDLTRRCDVREHCSLTITRFVFDLRSDSKHVMITSSYGVDCIEDTFGFALKIVLTFKGIIGAKCWEQCFSVLNVRDMDIMITSAPRRADMLIL